jgi:hypothetical protein
VVQNKPVIINNNYNRNNVALNNPVKNILQNNKVNKYQPPIIQKNVPQQKVYINRPISSKVDQKILAANNQIKKMPEPKVVGNQIKVSEKIIKNNNPAKNYVQNNPIKNNKYDVGRGGYNNGPRIVNIKK